MNLTTKYMGLNLKNPIIIASSGLTNSVENIKKLAEDGAGAIVLKSIFEEQIRRETEILLNQKDDVKMQPMLKGYDNMMSERPYDYAEALDYISNFAKENTLSNYLKFIEDAKKSVDIPIIASINCNSAYDWHYFARRVQEAGADALELNIYILPSDVSHNAEYNEQIYTDIIKSVKQHVTIPVALKIGYYFSSLTNKIIELSNSGINAMVLFNRPYTPDFDIDTFEITATNIFSNPVEYAQTLRWIGILHSRVGCDLSATTGIHSYQTVVKMLLAGADTVQIASSIYKNGNSVILEMLSGMEKWMKSHNFNSISDFKGKMSQSKIANPANYERVQFMKLYSNIV